MIAALLQIVGSDGVDLSVQYLPASSTAILISTI